MWNSHPYAFRKSCRPYRHARKAPRKPSITPAKLQQLVFILQNHRWQTAHATVECRVHHLQLQLAPCRFTKHELKAAVTWALVGKRRGSEPFEKVYAEDLDDVIRDPVMVIHEMGEDFEHLVLKGLNQVAVPSSGVLPGKIEQDPEAARKTATAIVRAAGKKFGGIRGQGVFEWKQQHMVAADAEAVRKEAA